MATLTPRLMTTPYADRHPVTSAGLSAAGSEHDFRRRPFCYRDVAGVCRLRRQHPTFGWATGAAGVEAETFRPVREALGGKIGGCRNLLLLSGPMNCGVKSTVVVYDGDPSMGGG